MPSQDSKIACATVCSLISAIAIPLLLYFGLLCHSKSRMIEIPEGDKPQAAVGCFIAAAMYLVTFVFSFYYQSTMGKGSRSARSVELGSRLAE